jgi:hypothetical protein
MAERAIDTAIDVSRPIADLSASLRAAVDRLSTLHALIYRASGGTNRRHPDCCGNSFFGATP